MSEEDEQLLALLNEVGRIEYTAGLSAAAKQLEKVQNAVVRLLRKYGCVDIEDLSLEQRERLRREVAHCALLLLISFPAIWRYFSAQSRPLLQLELESLIQLGWAEFWEEQNNRPPLRKGREGAATGK